MSTRCPHCHEDLEAEDLELKPVLPGGCYCDAEDWGDPNNIPTPCEAFRDDPNEPGLCSKCEHPAACHSHIEAE